MQFIDFMQTSQNFTAYNISHGISKAKHVIDCK